MTQCKSVISDTPDTNFWCTTYHPCYSGIALSSNVKSSFQDSTLDWNPRGHISRSVSIYTQPFRRDAPMVQPDWPVDWLIPAVYLTMGHTFQPSPSQQSTLWLHLTGKTSIHHSMSVPIATSSMPSKPTLSQHTFSLSLRQFNIYRLPPFHVNKSSVLQAPKQAFLSKNLHIFHPHHTGLMMITTTLILPFSLLLFCLLGCPCFEPGLSPSDLLHYPTRVDSRRPPWFTTSLF